MAHRYRDRGARGEGRRLRADPWAEGEYDMSAAEEALAPGGAVPLSLRGPAPTRVVAGYGFWLFLLSDIVIFAALFASYAVLSGETAGGPTAADLFDKRHVLIETACLLASSVTCGFGSLSAQGR